MQRMFELIEKVKKKYPEDKFFDNIEEDLQNKLAFEQYEIYEKAMQSLDENSWKLLSDKAIVAFKSNYKSKNFIEDQSREKIVKRSFFDHLNEAFGYQFLRKERYQNVSLLAEDKKKKNKSPDLEYEKNGIKYYCDVKTINRSDDDIVRYQEGNIFSGTIYQKLSDPFLNKLELAIKTAIEQIKSKNAIGIVYVLVNFDDFSEMFYDEYRNQIIEKLQSFPNNEVYIRIGIDGKKWIHKKMNQCECESFVLSLSPFMS